MSERSLRQRIPAPNRKLRPPQPSPSPSFRRRTPAANRRSSRASRPVRILRRSKSEPTLLTVGLVGEWEENRNPEAPPPDAVLFRPRTCTDIFSSSESLPPLSPQKFEGYKKDAKVVVNVTVEGSPGPIRTMVKLGSSVEETIRLVINKYSEEGRSPQLDKSAASAFELHHSCFSLECLSKSDVIGDMGSRSFYLRKGSSDHSSTSRNESGMMVNNSASFTAEIATASPSPLFFFLRAFIARNIAIIIRKTRKLWKMMGCMHCSG